MKNYYEYEELSITVIKRINKKKLAILIFLVVLFFIFLVLSINGLIRIAKSNKSENANLIEENTGIDNYIEKEDKAELEPKTAQEPEKIKYRLPILTEIGREKMANLYSIQENKIAYITFDDGPSTNVTPQILAILEQYKIKATFFVLGCNAERYQNLVKQEYEAGHYIANHGYSHVYDNIYSNTQAVLDEYNRTENIIKNAIQIPEYSSHLFRFPGGSMGTKYKNIKGAAKQVLSDNDIMYVDWNALTNDSVGKPTAESIIEDLKSTVGEKSTVVVLMHDTNSKQLTADTLPQVLDYLIEQGYEFRNFYDVIE